MDARDGAVETSRAESKALSNIGKEEISFHFSL